MLLDSVAKKTTAVADILAGCRIENVGVACGRAEEVARDASRRFAVVVARAVAPLPSLVELAAPLLEARGVGLWRSRDV